MLGGLERLCDARACGDAGGNTASWGGDSCSDGIGRPALTDSDSDCDSNSVPVIQHGLGAGTTTSNSNRCCAA